jgi:hypothetical protein
MADKKITKRDNFEAIAAFLADAGKTEWADVINHEIELLDNKAAKAKEAAAKKKAVNDELGDAVAAVLTDELTTIADITAKVDGGEDVTVHKVTNRLTRLVNAGVAKKEQISVPTADGKTRKVMAYALAD